MKTGVTLVLCVVAVVAAGVAIAAGPNQGLALPAAAIAVTAAALLLVGVVERTRWPPTLLLPELSADPARVRASIEAGASGRTDLIALLDRLDRQSGARQFSSTSPKELARLQTLSGEEFQEYLSVRVGDLEQRT